MNELNQSIARLLSQGVKRTQFLAQATADLSYDELVSLLENAFQVFVYKEFNLLQSASQLNRVSEDSIYTHKKLFVYLAKRVITLAEKRSFDRKTGKFYDLSLNERTILVAHYIMRMDWDLLGEIIDQSEDSIHDSLVRAESYLIDDNKIYQDLPVLINECPRVTKTLAFSRQVLSADKKNQIEDHLNDCSVCAKVFNHSKNSQDQMIKFIPTVELETKDIKEIVLKSMSFYEESQTRNLSIIEKGARKLMDFFSY